MEVASKPNVLVLLATYNGSLFLEEQLNSILAQSEVNVKILASDDNSDDESPQILSNFIKSNANIEKLSRNNKNGSAGQNFFQLIRSCEYKDFDYIAFSDQDDIWLKNKLSSGIECLQNSSAYGYSCSSLAFWESGKEKLITQNKSIRNLDFLFEGAGQGCTFILKSSFFSEVQRFCIDKKNITDMFYYHDWLIYLIARTNYKKWYFDERSFIRYRQHETNDTGASGSFRGIKSRLSLIANGWYKRQIEVALKISKLTIKSNPEIEEFEKIFTKSDSLYRRLILVRFFIFNGRRKAIDRVILVFASFVGWI